MKAYIAGKYDRRDELRDVKEKIEKTIHLKITSRWLDETEPLQSDMGDHSPEFYKLTAEIDIQDVLEADMIIFFSEDPLEPFKRGGRHVEFGVALASQKAVVVIGPKENVFHYLQGVQHYHSVDHFIQTYTESMQTILAQVKEQHGEEAALIARKKLGLDWVQEKGGSESGSISR